MVGLIIATLPSVLFGQNPILIPPHISGTQFNLNLQTGTHQFISGVNTNTMGVNGSILGPTLIMEQGDLVDILVTNSLMDTTTIHWHGMHVSAENDGGPHTKIYPGATWNPSFTVLDRAGTYWYHPHLHEQTNKHVSKGIAGFIIVKDSEEALLSLPRDYGVDDFPLVIQTKDFDANNEIIHDSNSDDVAMVNATVNGSLNVPAQIVRLRLLNGSSQRVFNIGLQNDLSFVMIASDGGLLESSVSLTRLRLAPGERAEILVDLGSFEGQSVSLKSYASELPSGLYGATNPGMMSMMSLTGYNPNALNGSDFSLLTLNVTTPTSAPLTTIPTSLSSISMLDENLANETRSLVFTPEAMGPNQLNGHFLINGNSFDMNTINYTIPLNNIEIWSIRNQSAIAHPFHIHDVQFQILDRNGNAPPLEEQGYKDVVLIRPMETVRFITQFTTHANSTVPYMYHCHMLVHEDDGMMGQFVVVDPNSISDVEPELTNNIEVFPNPVINNKTSISLDEEIESIVLFDANGRVSDLKVQLSDPFNSTIILNDKPKGIYILHVRGKRKKHISKIVLM